MTQIWWLAPLSLEAERGLNRDPDRNLREPIGGRPLPGVVGAAGREECRVWIHHLGAGRIARGGRQGQH